jgi:hypothetical protein
MRDTMSTVHAPNSAAARSPFSEVRDTHRQATLAVVATAAVAASASLITAFLVALGIGA